MTGPEHYKEAERLLEYVKGVAPAGRPDVLAMAQIHATLALAAATAADQATAYDGDELGQRSRGWAGVA